MLFLCLQNTRFSTIRYSRVGVSWRESEIRWGRGSTRSGCGFRLLHSGCDFDQYPVEPGASFRSVVGPVNPVFLASLSESRFQYGLFRISRTNNRRHSFLDGNLDLNGIQQFFRRDTKVIRSGRQAIEKPFHHSGRTSRLLGLGGSNTLGICPVGNRSCARHGWNGDAWASTFARPSLTVAASRQDAIASPDDKQLQQNQRRSEDHHEREDRPADAQQFKLASGDDTNSQDRQKNRNLKAQDRTKHLPTPGRTNSMQRRPENFRAITPLRRSGPPSDCE